MPHKYSNFSIPFGELISKYGVTKQALEWAYTNAHEAYIGASDPVDKLHFGYATYAIEQVVAAMRYLGDYTEASYDQSHFFESMYWSWWAPKAATITMDSILAAMVAATPEQVTYFVGLADAYRQSIWNKPFNSEFFAALARGFQEWP